MTMIRLDHVSTKDGEVSEREIERALAALRAMRAELSQGVTVATRERPDPRRSLGLWMTSRLEVSKDPDRTLGHLGRGRDTLDALTICSCSLPFADPAGDPVVAAAEAIDLAKAALLLAPRTRGKAAPIIAEAMKGVTWLMKDELPRRVGNLPNIWLAASPTRSALISSVPYSLQGPLPHVTCLAIGRTDRDGVAIHLGGYSGHCRIDAMTAVDGLRAVAALDEWRRSIA